MEMRRNVATKPKKYQSWKIENGRLYKFHTSAFLDPVLSREEGWKLVVFRELRERVIRETHDSPSMEHFVVGKSSDRIAREYYWRVIIMMVKCGLNNAVFVRNIRDSKDSWVILGLSLHAI